MRYSSPWLLGCGAAAGLLVAACRDKEEATAPPSAPTPARQGVEGFFDPQPREIWTYAGTRDFPPDTSFGPDMEDRIRNLPGGAKRLEFERRRICAGPFRPESTDRDLTSFDIYEDGQLTEREIYDITSAGVIGRGWAPAKIPLSEGVLLSPGIKIATVGMSGGQSWDVPTEDPDHSFKLDVIERVEITVPAGVFEAARLRITVQSSDRSTKRTVWFAENVGIVKEEVIHYDDDQIRVREQLELVQWMLPTIASRPGSERPGSAPASPSDYTQVSLTAPVETAPPNAEDELIEDPYEGAVSLPPEEPAEGDANEDVDPNTDDTEPGEEATSTGENSGEQDENPPE